MKDFKEEKKENEYDIWKEGYSVTGNKATARCLARGIKAASFKDACIKLDKEINADNAYGHFNSKSLSFWACRLFETEEEARKTFG